MKLRSAPLVRTSAVGVVVPAHNEQSLLAEALRSLVDAFDELSQWEVSLKAAIVLDSCTDDSEEIAREWQHNLARNRSFIDVTIVICHAKNVGYARGLGCSTLLAQSSRFSPSEVWLATTDADSRVPRDWLSTQVIQHEVGVDHWSGRVTVADWSEHRSDTRAWWQNEYEEEIRPIHGSSLGFNGAAYLAAGGFVPLKTGEDRALNRALVAHGARTHYDSAIRVVTSARRRARAPLGFAYALDVINTAMRARTTS